MKAFFYKYTPIPQKCQSTPCAQFFAHGYANSLRRRVVASFLALLPRSRSFSPCCNRSNSPTVSTTAPSFAPTYRRTKKNSRTRPKRSKAFKRNASACSTRREVRRTTHDRESRSRLVPKARARLPPDESEVRKKGSRERNASKTSSIRRARAFFARIVSQLFEECGRLAGPNKTAGILPVFFLSHAHQNSRKRSARLPRRLDSSSSSSSGRKRRRNRRLVKKKGGR